MESIISILILTESYGTKNLYEAFLFSHVPQYYENTQSLSKGFVMGAWGSIQ